MGHVVVQVVVGKCKCRLYGNNVGAGCRVAVLMLEITKIPKELLVFLRPGNPGEILGSPRNSLEILWRQVGCPGAKSSGPVPQFWGKSQNDYPAGPAG